MTEDATSELPPIHRTEVDGVPVFWVEDTLPCRAALVFRVGHADETLATRGITHLVEHMAMAAVGELPYFANASVDLTSTTFVTRGSPDEVAQFMKSVCEAFASLPLDRIRIEGRVLRTEAVGRSAGVVEHMNFLRYGYTGFGLGWADELFLNDPRPAPVQAWAATRFTRDNCVVWIAGRLPENLALPLPPGYRYPLPVSRLIGEVKLPSAAQYGKESVAMAWESPRTSSSTTAVRIALNRLFTRARLEEGITYQVGYDRGELSTSLAINTVWLTCLEEQAAAVRSALLAVLGDMAEHGPTEEELEEDLKGFIRAGTDPDARAGDVAAAANYELVGMPAFGFQELLAERKAVTAEMCASELMASLGTALLRYPGAAGRPPTIFNHYSTNAGPPIAGKTFSKLGTRPWQKHIQIVAGPEGMSLVRPDGRVTTVRWADCVALEMRGGGIWTLYGADGYSIEFDSTNWKDGAALRDLIDRSVPVELRVSPPI
jgi:hypothetical protein